MFCQKSLGTNEVVEEFPVGRRLAFDAARGRLWVVCRSCERWNLTPLEERWEAVERCERLFRGTRLRTSSQNIGLAKHREGLELVRIGKPLRPEFAAWRYGDQFGRRRNRMILLGNVAGLATTGGIVAGGMLIGFAGGTFAFNVAQFIYNMRVARARIRFRTSDGQVRKLGRGEVLATTRIEPADDEVGFRVQTHTGIWVDGYREWLEGDDARRALAAIIPSYNVMGGRKDTVGAAVSEIESLGHPQRFLLDVASRGESYIRNSVPGFVNEMPKSTKLALEMALHEEDERRAMGGELRRLEQAWRDAEEIAAISDDLLLPKGTDEFVARHRDSQGWRSAMYQTCMFCKKPLGSNEVLESFPVGRRLAFDAAKGRLWVVCIKCRRWNLTPLEERWEAVEDCERLFRATPTRASTENIGIARHREGLYLVRIGKPPRGSSRRGGTRMSSALGGVARWRWAARGMQ